MGLPVGTLVVTMNPGVCGPWEATATIDDVAAVAEAADRPGFSPPDVLRARGASDGRGRASR